MSDIKIEDDFLPSSEWKKIEELFVPDPLGLKPSSRNWDFGIIEDPHLGNEISYDNYQLCHHIYHASSPTIGVNPIVSSSAHVIIPIFFSKIDPIGDVFILRIKANLLMRTSEIIPHSFHTDYKITSNRYDKVTTSIFYINSNDGYTEFEDGTKIESVSNRLVTFPHNMKHRGTTCTDKPFRMVINFNYF